MAALDEEQETNLQILSGKIFPNKKVAESWKLHRGEGDRTYSETIQFEKPFKKKPIVLVSISAEDVLNGHGSIYTHATNIDEKGFDLHIDTWKDTKLWSACASWIAYDKEFTNQKGFMTLSDRTILNKANPAYNLHKGKGDRQFSFHVEFENDFVIPPSVFVSLSQLDALNESDIRISVKGENIKKTGFDIVVNTWSDSIIFSCHVTWLAFDKSFEAAGPGIRIFTGRMAFKKADKDFTLSKGDGSRATKRRINFPHKFSENPAVVTTLSEMDVLRDTDHRVNTVAENITAQGFDLKVGTWSDTFVWSASSSWLAFGHGEKKEEPKKDEPPKKKAKIDDGEKKGDDDDKKAEVKVDEVEKECKICFDSEINTVIIPCGHMCVCEECSKLLTKNNKCPICKGVIQKVVKTFLA